jgi:hypothetical protein
VCRWSEYRHRTPHLTRSRALVRCYLASATQSNLIQHNPVLSYPIYPIFIPSPWQRFTLSYPIKSHSTSQRHTMLRDAVSCHTACVRMKYNYSQPASLKLLYFFFAPMVPAHRFHIISNLFCFVLFILFFTCEFFETKVIASE